MERVERRVQATAFDDHVVIVAIPERLDIVIGAELHNQSVLFVNV